MKISNSVPVILAAIMVNLSAHAEDAPEPEKFGVSENPMAIQGEAVLTQAELDAAMTRIPPEHRLSYIRAGERVDMMIQSLLRNRLLADKAREAGFDETRLAEIRMNLAAEKELADYWLAQVMEEMPDADFEALAQEKYLLNQDEYMTEAMVDVSHILINSESRTDEEAFALATELRQQLAEDPERFQDLVVEYSDDPSKEVNGGRFKDVNRGKMVKPFEDKAFSMTERGEISEPVKTNYGYHIIRLNNIIPPRQIVFNEVRNELVAQEKAAYERGYKSRYIRGVLSEDIVVPQGAVDEMVKRYFGEDLSGADIYPAE